LITVLRQHNGATVDLSQPAPHRTRRGRPKVKRRSRCGAHAAATTDAATPKGRRPRRVKNASRRQMSERKQDGCREPTRPASGEPTPPTSRMVSFAKRLAKDKRATLPSGYDKDFDICRRFLDQHAGRLKGLAETALGFTALAAVPRRIALNCLKGGEFQRLAIDLPHARVCHDGMRQAQSRVARPVWRGGWADARPGLIERLLQDFDNIRCEGRCVE
jgi:hypothetical protein